MLDLEAATAWIDERLASAGVDRTGPLESVRVRPWGEVARADSDRGPIWLKAPGGATGFEVPLYELLARWVPERILVPLAIDRSRGWVLLPDGGPSLGERAKGEELAAALPVALRHYGELQRALAGDADELLAIGVTDMRPQAMPGRFDEALAAGRRYADGSADERDRAVPARFEAARERFEAQCSDLASRPGGASLDHNDLHPWNILGDPGAGGSTRFYDWGDSVVAHPFAAMLVPLGFAARVSPRAVETARDAYLDAFGDLGSHAELVETLELACRVAKVARALTWERALLAGDEAEADPDFARAPLATLESYLGESYLGGA